MDSPVFKLEQVVQSREGLEDFEGPLDLILFLLSKNKIEIQDIPIALILDQYLEYLELRQKMDLEIASEFVTMAAQLMFIKSRMLLSIEDEVLHLLRGFFKQAVFVTAQFRVYLRREAVPKLLSKQSAFQ